MARLRAMRDRSLVLLLVAALLGCTPHADRVPAAPVTSQGSAPPSAAPERPHDTAPASDGRTQEVSIEGVESGNPLIVRGRARTFENAVSVRVRDATGAPLSETHVTSAGEMGQHNPFEAPVWIVRDPGPQITVEAFEYSAKDGSIRSLTSRTVAYTVAPIDVTLMFSGPDCSATRAVTRRIPKSPAMARLMVEALMAGPTATERADGATSPFPHGSAVQSVLLRHGDLTVDFNERLQNVGGSCAALAVRESVTRTLKQLPTVQNVIITAGGSRELALQP